MLLERGDHPAQHHPALLFGRLLDFHHLEAPRERCVLFEELLVLGPRRGGDRTQFAAGERRLQQIGRIVLPRLASRPDHGVGLVDEQMIGVGEAFTSSISPLSRFSNSPFTPAPACSSARSSVRTRRVAQRRRHVALGYSQREAFHHRGLSYARLSGQDRVVLPPPGEDIDDLPDLEIAGQNRVDLAGAGVCRQVHVN